MIDAGPSWQESRGFRLGAAIGALILTYAGAAWGFAALILRGTTPPWELGVFALPVLALTVLGARRVAAISKEGGGGSPGNAQRGRRVGLWFGAIFGVEGGLIAFTSSFFARAGRPLLIPVAVVGIVGAHFLPLSGVFRVPTYAVTGALLFGCALGSLLIADEPTRVFALGIATALVLWVSAAAVLLIHTGGRERAT